ncbi:MAG: division/cell wall cluster transcriptional repressor MraZ [Elusimicrobiota bacterium]
MVKSGGKLIGEYSHSVDTKKRVFIPVDFRITKTWIVTAGLEKCLFLFPDNEWEKITEGIKNLPLTKKDARSFVRILLSRARILACDNQGRILLPDKLIEYAQIKRSCTVIGMLNRIEFWNPKKWNEYFQKSEKNYSELAENITELDF